MVLCDGDTSCVDGVRSVICGGTWYVLAGMSLRDCDGFMMVFVCVHVYIYVHPHTSVSEHMCTQAGASRRGVQAWGAVERQTAWLLGETLMYEEPLLESRCLTT